MSRKTIIDILDWMEDNVDYNKDTVKIHSHIKSMLRIPASIVEYNDCIDIKDEFNAIVTQNKELQRENKMLTMRLKGLEGNMSIAYSELVTIKSKWHYKLFN